MKIDEKYTIENDSNQWVLNYRSEGDINKRTGKPTISTNKWYCGSLKQCLNRYLDESLKQSTTIQEVVANINIAMERITELTSK